MTQTRRKKTPFAAVAIFVAFVHENLRLTNARENLRLTNAREKLRLTNARDNLRLKNARGNLRLILRFRLNISGRLWFLCLYQTVCATAALLSATSAAGLDHPSRGMDRLGLPFERTFDTHAECPFQLLLP